MQYFRPHNPLTIRWKGIMKKKQKTPLVPSQRKPEHPNIMSASPLEASRKTAGAVISNIVQAKKEQFTDTILTTLGLVAFVMILMTLVKGSSKKATYPLHMGSKVMLGVGVGATGVYTLYHVLHGLAGMSRRAKMLANTVKAAN